MIEGNCYSRPKKRFMLFFEAHQPHEFEITHIERWGMVSWGKHTVDFKCKHCGVRHNKFGVSDVELYELKHKLNYQEEDYE